MPGMKKANAACTAYIQGPGGLTDARHIVALIRADRARQEAPLPDPEEDAWSNAAAVLRARESRTFIIDSDEAPTVLAAMGYAPLRTIRED